MEEVKLTKEQEILFEVYDKGVQNEDCDLDAYVEKMKQALSVAFVSQQRELFDAILDFTEDLPMCSEDYNRDTLYKRYIAENCG